VLPATYIIIIRRESPPEHEVRAPLFIVYEYFLFKGIINEDSGRNQQGYSGKPEIKLLHWWSTWLAVG
jgi:hypothetical protein